MGELKLQRDNSIDLLRFIGLTCIMLAHVAPPNGIFQIRTFDVPLMIFISGLSYSGRSISSYGDFLKKRVKRLLVPIYIYLACYFLLNFIFAKLGIAEQVPMKKIQGTFLLQLQPSIGYLWIIRIFLIVMLVTPLLIKIEGWIKSNILFIATIAALFVGQHYFIGWLRPMHLGRFVDDYLLYLGYSIPFLIGMRMRRVSISYQWVMAGLLAVAFVVMAMPMIEKHNTWMVMQRFKYPPQVYYMLWGGVVSSVLWATKEYWKRLLDWSGVYFVAQNTIWIYLWHIPFAIYAAAHLSDLSWWVRLIIVYGAAITMFSIQSKIVDILGRKGYDTKGYIKQYFKG